MKRRDFLKKSSLTISAVAIAGITGSSFRDLLAINKKSSMSFSFEIITDKPEEALKLSQEFFRNNSFDNTIIKFSEFPVKGEAFGDIVFVKDGKLINYKNGTGKIYKDISVIAESLKLPKKLSDPTRLRFNLSENDSPAENFLVFHKNNLIKTISAEEKDLNIILTGTKGDVLLNIGNKKAKVLSSSCTHKTCVNSGSISNSGESIVCIPNELVILCE